MPNKKWLIEFDTIVSCTMAVEAESEDDARNHLTQQLKLTAGSFCEAYGWRMELQEDTIVVKPDYLDDEQE